MYGRKRRASAKTSAHAGLNRICLKDLRELCRKLEQYEA